jgi:hypothetical protein
VSPIEDPACPYCEPVDGPRSAGQRTGWGWREQAEAYARLTGLTLARVGELLAGARLTPGDVATAVWAGCIEPWAAAQLIGGRPRLADLVAHHDAGVVEEGARSAGEEGRGRSRLCRCAHLLARAFHVTR